MVVCYHFAHALRKAAIVFHGHELGEQSVGLVCRRFACDTGTLHGRLVVGDGGLRLLRAWFTSAAGSLKDAKPVLVGGMAILLIGAFFAKMDWVTKKWFCTRLIEL